MHLIDRDFNDFDILNHRKVRKPKKFNHRKDYLNELCDSEFFDRFRMSKDSFKVFLSKIETKIVKNSGR
jgi:hypothetical protein